MNEHAAEAKAPLRRREVMKVVASTKASKIKLVLPIWRKLQQVDSSIWLVGALLVATATRLPMLGQQSLWWDEGITYSLIRPEARINVVFENTLMTRDAAPLYYLLLRMWTALFGTSEFVLRVPSAFFGIINVALMYSLGKLSAHRNTGVWAAWFLAVNPFHIWYSRDARPYTLALMLVTCVMRCFLLGIRYGKWRHWLALMSVSGLAYLTHYITGAIGVIQLSFFLTTLRKTYRSLRKWIAVQALGVIPAASWLILSMLLYGYSGLRRPGIPKPTFLAPIKTLWNFSLAYDGQFTILTALGLLPFGVIMACKGLKVKSLWQARILTWLVLPPSLAFVLSSLLEPVYMDRYLSICVVAYLLWLAARLTTLSPGILQALLGAMILVAMLGSSIGIISGQRLEKPDWRTAIDQVLKKAQEGDRLLVAQGFHVAFYYANYDLPIEILNGDLPTALDRALREAHREWLLYRDPGVTNSNHVIINANRFNPYESGQSGITEWLSNHNKEICREWFLDGLYLALMESEGCSGKAAKPTAQ